MRLRQSSYTVILEYVEHGYNEFTLIANNFHFPGKSFYKPKFTDITNICLFP